MWTVEKRRTNLFCLLRNTIGFSNFISGHKAAKTNQTSKRIFEGYVDMKFEANKEFLENLTS